MISATRTTRQRATVDSQLSSLRSIADLIRHLGGIPAGRIRLHPAPGTATEADAIALNNNKHRDHLRCELIDGVLVERAMGTQEAQLAALVVHYFREYLARHKLGSALGGDAMFRLRPGRIRLPDAAFVSRERLPAGESPVDAMVTFGPDLAVEVRSEGKTRREIAQKIDDYFRASARLVWIIDPKTHSADVYTSPTAFTHVEPKAKLLGADVLPGFMLPLHKLFERPNRKRHQSSVERDKK